MVNQRIVFYDNPILRRVSEPVAEVDEQVRGFVAEMFTTIKRSRGLGLSAPQVGVNRRIFILDLSSVSLEFDQLVVINPAIVEVDGEQTVEEGCLSFPGLFLEITRPQRVICEYTDLDGQRQRLTAEGLPARAILHEYDHLNGKLFIDYLTPADRELISGKLKKIKAAS